MKKKLMISLIITTMLFIQACGSSTAQVQAPAEPTPAPTAVPTPEPTPEVKEEPSEVQSDKKIELGQGNDSSLAAISKLMSKNGSQSDKEAPVLYADEFDEVDDYEEYSDPANEKDLMNKLIKLEGTAVRYVTKERKALIVFAEGGEWAVDGGSKGTDIFYEKLESCVDEDVRVYCSYAGYDKKLEMPVVTFVPKNAIDHGFRLEVPDNDFRLTYTDYACALPELKNEQKVGSIYFKEPKKWSKDVDGEQIVYSVEQNEAYRMFMAYFYELPEGALDEVDRNELLEEVAKSMASDGTELSKESVEVLGRDGLCIETSFKDEEAEFPMDLYSYIFAADNGVYYFGTGEPYLAGETGKELLLDIVDTIRREGEESKKDDKKAETKKEDSKKEDTKKEETKEEESKAESKKTHEAGDHPTKSELQGKVFSMYATGAITDTTTGEQITYNDRFDNWKVTAADLASYYEPAGTLTYTDIDDGISMGMQLEVFYDFNGKLMYKGKAIMNDPIYIGELTVTGMEQ